MARAGIIFIRNSNCPMFKKLFAPGNDSFWTSLALLAAPLKNKRLVEGSYGYKQATPSGVWSQFAGVLKN